MTLKACQELADDFGFTVSDADLPSSLLRFIVVLLLNNSFSCFILHNPFGTEAISILCLAWSGFWF